MRGWGERKRGMRQFKSKESRDRVIPGGHCPDPRQVWLSLTLGKGRASARTPELGAALADGLRSVTVLQTSPSPDRPLLYRVLASTPLPPRRSLGPRPQNQDLLLATAQWNCVSSLVSCLFFLYLQHSDEGLNQERRRLNS